MTGPHDINGAQPASPSADVVLGERAAGLSPTPFHAASVPPCAGVCPVGLQAGRAFSLAAPVVSCASYVGEALQVRPVSDDWPDLFFRRLTRSGVMQL